VCACVNSFDTVFMNESFVFNVSIERFLSNLQHSNIVESQNLLIIPVDLGLGKGPFNFTYYKNQNFENTASSHT